jgi:hypothetical protein
VPTARDRRGGRRLGAAIGLGANLLLLVLVHGWPGWAAVPFLTRDFASVLPLVDVSLAFGALADLVILVLDRRLLSAALDVGSAAIAVAVSAALLRVFPFDFGVVPADDAIARIVLVVAVTGAAIGFVVQVVRLVAILAGNGRGPRLSAGS